MSDTPRTDAASFFPNVMGAAELTHASVARQLERELAVAKQVRPTRGDVKLLEQQLAEAKAEVDRLKEVNRSLTESYESANLRARVHEQQRDALAAQVQALREALRKCSPAHVWDIARQYYTTPPELRDPNEQTSPILSHHNQLCELQHQALALTPATALKGWVRRDLLEQMELDAGSEKAH